MTKPHPESGPLFAGALPKTASAGGRSFSGDIRARATRATPGEKCAGGPYREVSHPQNLEQRPPKFFSGLEKSCSKCGEMKPRTLQAFPACPRKSDGLRAECRKCHSAVRLARYAQLRGDAYKPSEARRVAKKALVDRYSAGDLVAAQESRRLSRQKKRAADGRCLSERLRGRIARALGPSGKSHYSLGCTPADLKRHIERQFLKGMSWANRDQWHVDHIRPLASFDLTDPEQLRTACHFTNLRPLWAAENMRKGAKLEVLL